MIKPKMGYCTECGNTEPKPIIKDLCQYHYWKSKRKPITVKPFKIRPVSKIRQEALKRYARLREKYFEKHPVCEFPGCSCREITLHHMRGRVGSFLTDKRYFKSLCWPHHQWVEEHPAEAIRMQLSLPRLDKL